MNELDPSSSLEQYCSPYYDKKGLYNDGFPCPSDKYCCQNSDGSKYCCVLNQRANENAPQQPNANKKFPFLYTPSTTKFSKSSHNEQSRLNQHNTATEPSSHFASASNEFTSSFPMIFTNNILLISVCIGLFVLIIVAVALALCIIKNCNKRKRQPCDSHIIKSNRNTASRISGSSTNTTSSLTTPIVLNIDSNDGMSDEMNHKILSIDAHSHNHHNYMNSMSCGSAMTANMLLNINSASSANTTHTSLTATSMHHHNINENIVDLEFDENEENEDDFIMYTSNNLEFLKTQSLFGASAPLNFYPSLIKSSKIKSSTKSPIDEPPAYNTNSNLLSQNLTDFRFSTFLPPIYSKSEHL